MAKEDLVGITTIPLDQGSYSFLLACIYNITYIVSYDLHGRICMSEIARARVKSHSLRRSFIGGSDARIIMGKDEAALCGCGRRKRGSRAAISARNLIVQLGVVTEELDRRWYQANTGHAITDVQKRIRHAGLHWMAATLDGRVASSGAIFEAKFMLRWSFSEEAAVTKYMPQLQHNMWVVAARAAVLSVITGGGKWVEIRVHADPLYQHLIVTAERKFWRCVENGENSCTFWHRTTEAADRGDPCGRYEFSNAWAELAAIFSRTRPAHLEHERAKAELKGLVPDDAGRPSATAFAPNARSRALSVSTFSPSRQAMQRSSASIGSLAAASAKAQRELANPDKSLVATINAAGPGAKEKTFGMHHCRADLISCAKPWDSMR